MKLLELFEEKIDTPDLEVGDTIKIGKFKNKKAEIKGAETDSDGQVFLKTNKGKKRLFNFKTMNESEILQGGLADGMTLQNIADKHNVSLDSLIHQVELGVLVELEHTDDQAIAHEIVMDHLFEIPDYYDKLDKMEK